MSQDSIRVVCRLRTLNKIQISNNGQQCVQFDDKNLIIQIGGDQNKYNFSFDKIFGPKSLQNQVYKQVAIPVIKSVISGFNGTIFAYGQTGAGKTWTMQGPNHFDNQFKGLIPRTVDGLFQQITQSDQNIQFIIKCSYVEIYNEKIFDLLDPSKARLQIKQDKHKGVFIQNCTQVPVGSNQQMLKVMNNGSLNRKVAFTGMNQRSSRSHSLFIIHVSQKNLTKDSTKQSRLYFVDLAGSQKVGKTNVQGQQLQQAKNINKSLSALGNVINALTSDKKQHIPYRDSKLTRILQESLGGNSKTTLIICCSMCTYNDKETLSTLRFGYRAKSIKNKAKVNQQKSVKELMMLLEAANKTIYQLKVQIKSGVVKGTLSPSKKQDQQQQQSVKLQHSEPQFPSNLQQKLSWSQQKITHLQSQLSFLLSSTHQQSLAIKQQQLKIKSLLLEIDQQKHKHNQHMSEYNFVYKKFKQCMVMINKYVKRCVIDVEYFINSEGIKINSDNVHINQNINKQSYELSSQQNNINNNNKQLKSNLTNFLLQSQQYLTFYQNKLKHIFEYLQRQANCKDLQNFQIYQQEDKNMRQQSNNDEENNQYHQKYQSSFNHNKSKKKLHFTLSQPQLFPSRSPNNLDNINPNIPTSTTTPQPHFFSQISHLTTQSNPNTSDKLSQQQSFTQIQTLLQSLQTKQSHKFIIQQLNSSLKQYKKQNQELQKKIQKIKQENTSIKDKIQQKYEEKIQDLEERVQQYKNIIGKKDQQIQTFYIKEEKIKKQLMEEKIICERFKKIIQNNSSMKHNYQVQQKLRNLASQRQKINNQMFNLRSQLDQAQLTIKQKQDHIESLKQVMKQLSNNNHNNNFNNHNIFNNNTNSNNDSIKKHQTALQIQKRYNTKIYGTQLPNIIQPIRGGDHYKKQSNLRKKITIDHNKQKQQKNTLGAYFKGFFG